MNSRHCDCDPLIPGDVPEATGPQIREDPRTQLEAAVLEDRHYFYLQVWERGS
jgi:hypothetical protein